MPKASAPQPVTFQNTQHLYYGQQSVKIEPGRGAARLPAVIPKAVAAKPPLAAGLAGRQPRQTLAVGLRAGAWYTRKGGFFETRRPIKPGNLFTYDEPVRITPG